MNTLDGVNCEGHSYFDFYIIVDAANRMCKILFGDPTKSSLTLHGASDDVELKGFVFAHL